MKLSAKIESILFYTNEPLSVQKLARFFDEKPEEIETALKTLKNTLDDRGLALIEKDGEVLLGTAPEAADIIEEIKEDEINKDLTKAELETLTIILYRGPLPKSEIDYIRGVNAGTILRKLRVRGLIEKQRDSDNKRRFLYGPTTETLEHLGIESIDELPEYTKIEEKIDQFKQKNEERAEKNPFH